MIHPEHYNVVYHCPFQKALENKVQELAQLGFIPRFEGRSPREVWQMYKENTALCVHLETNELIIGDFEVEKARNLRHSTRNLKNYALILQGIKWTPESGDIYFSRQTRKSFRVTGITVNASQTLGGVSVSQPLSAFREDFSPHEVPKLKPKLTLAEIEEKLGFEFDLVDED